MSNEDFAQPAQGGDKFDLKNKGNEWLGALLLIWPTEFKPQFDSGEYDPTDVVVADIAFVDRVDPETGKPLYLRDAFIFAKGLVNNTKRSIGGRVLGRLAKRQFTKGVGWTLEDFTPADVEAARQYLAQYPREEFSQPAAAAPAPAPAPAQPDPWAAAQSPPAPAPSATPTPAAAYAAPAGPDHPAVAATVAAFLASKGVQAPPDPATALMIAKSFPDFTS